MSRLYLLFYDLVKQIPYGMVTTYGEIAAASGNIKRSRIVGSAMAQCRDNTVPCHRVVLKDGYLSRKFSADINYQKMMLENEGVEFENDRVNLTRHLYIFEQEVKNGN